jgi:heptosyltransferase-2
MADMPDPAHILAIAPNWLGDAVMCTPALRAIKRRFPQSTLAVAGQPAICALLDGLPWVGRLHPLPSLRGLFSLLSASWTVNEDAQDLAVVFPHSFRAALLARLARAKRRVGYNRDNRSWLLTDAPEPHRENGVVTPVYMAHEYLELVAPLGCADDGLGLELAADPAERAAVRERLAGDGPLVALAPGAAFGPAKRWPAERFAAVADALAARRGARCVLLTGPGEEETRAAVLAAVKRPLLEFPGGGIARLKAVLAEADLLIGNDSGPRHIAIAFGRPVICVMGPTSPRYTDSPWEKGRLLRVDVDCGPCQKPICSTDHRCMTRIAADAVVEAALPFLQQ